VKYLHVTHRANVNVDLAYFDAIFLSYCARLCFKNYVSKTFLRKVKKFSGVKAIAIQDEYDFVENERLGLDFIQPDLVFTCIPAAQLGRVYPPERYPRTRFVQVLTGYQPSLDLNDLRKSLSARGITLGYRGRPLSRRYGKLGEAKVEIGQFFLRECARRGYRNVDISVAEEGRIYGHDWYRWLADCRCILGVESGSNVFDFDGEIAKAVEQSLVAGQPLGADIEKQIDQLDREFSIGQISPRVFEAAAVGTPMALYEGDYSGILTPHVHYFPISKDKSNLNEFFQFLDSDTKLQEIADNAYEHLIESKRFTYKEFVGEIESKLRACQKPRGLHQAIRKSPLTAVPLTALPPHSSSLLLSEVPVYLYSVFRINFVRRFSRLPVPIKRSLHGIEMRLGLAKLRLSDPRTERVDRKIKKTVNQTTAKVLKVVRRWLPFIP